MKKTGKDIQSDSRALQLLRREVEKAKRELSDFPQVIISIDNLIDGLNFRETITQARFEEMCKDLFNRTMTYI